MKMNWCPKCREYRLRDKYCFSCGSKLGIKELEKCVCGDDLFDGQRFCKRCGRSHEEATSSKRLPFYKRWWLALKSE